MHRLSLQLALSTFAFVGGMTPALADVAPEPTKPTILPIVVAVLVAAAAAYFTYRYFRRRRK